MANWYSQIQSIIFTKVQYMLKKTYPTLKCTTKSQNETPASFPTLYLHEMQPVEVGQDLTNETVNAIRSTIEIQVWTNTTDLDCRNILDSAVTEMKNLHYNISALPVIESQDRLSWGVIRCTRIIGSADEI